MLAGLPACADVYTLNYFNVNGAGTYGMVELTDNGTNTVHVKVDLSSGLKFINAGYEGSFDFDLIGNPTISFSSITSGWTPLGTTAGSHKFDGIGDFEYGLDCDCGPGGSNPKLGPLEFDVTAAGLTLASFKEKSGEGYYFGADAIDYNLSGNPTGAIGASGDPLHTPEPGSIILFGTIALGTSGLLRRKLAKR
jgi:hypothetical protein